MKRALQGAALCEYQPANTGCHPRDGITERVSPATPPPTRLGTELNFSAPKRETPMYYPIIHQCSQALKTIEVWLDKAEQHAAAKKYDVGVLKTSRLAPEMREFIYQ